MNRRISDGFTANPDAFVNLKLLPLTVFEALIAEEDAMNVFCFETFGTNHCLIYWNLRNSILINIV